MTGAVAAYLRFAYNLYLVAHNQRIQKRLIERLKDNKQFHGAYYETYVAATFIKAGFDLWFENEDDGSKRHCEFTATCKRRITSILLKQNHGRLAKNMRK